MERIQYDNPEFQTVIDTIYEYGQEHVFQFWNYLSEGQKIALLEQLKTVDFSLMKNLVEQQIINPSQPEQQHFETAHVIPLPKTEDDFEQYQEAVLAGKEVLKQGKVAVFIVAGGQGSRLGYDGPKGCYRITPLRDKSIFQLHCEKIKGLGKKYGTTFPLYIMTSDANHDETKDFFEDHNYFGLEEIHFFKQGMMPAVNSHGKLILEKKHKIFMNPNGHGGSIYALKESGAINHMKSSGITQIFYMQVDNILVNILDPAFLGYHLLEKAEMSSKVVKKASPEEKVGVIGVVNGRTTVIEYSVLPDDLRYERTSNGELKYEAGSIAIHLLNVDFVERVYSEKLPFTKAFKAIPYLDDAGELVQPEQPNAYKFEMFVFDALGIANKTVTVMTDRKKDFAPVKNKNGNDSPATARKLLSDYYKSWLKKAGVDVAEDAIVEISPLYAIDAQELKQKLAESNVPLRYDQEIYLG